MCSECFENVPNGFEVALFNRLFDRIAVLDENGDDYQAFLWTSKPRTLRTPHLECLNLTATWINEGNTI